MFYYRPARRSRHESRRGGRCGPTASAFRGPRGHGVPRVARAFRRPRDLGVRDADQVRRPRDLGVRDADQVRRAPRLVGVPRPAGGSRNCGVARGARPCRSGGLAASVSLTLTRSDGPLDSWGVSRRAGGSRKCGVARAARPRRSGSFATRCPKASRPWCLRHRVSTFWRLAIAVSGGVRTAFAFRQSHHCGMGGARDCGVLPGFRLRWADGLTGSAVRRRPASP